jgi:hypothetical protein
VASFFRKARANPTTPYKHDPEVCGYVFEATSGNARVLHDSRTEGSGANQRQEVWIARSRLPQCTRVESGPKTGNRCGRSIVFVEGVAPGSQRFSAQALKQDLDILWRAIDEAHGNPFAYVDRDTLRATFDGAADQLSAMSEPEFAAVVACLLAGMRDGHTRAYPSESFMDSLTARPQLLPFKADFAGGRLIVVAAHAGELPVGAELVALGGRPVRDILDLLRPLVPIDGYAEAGREWLLAAQFDLLYSMFIERGNSYRVGYRMGKGPVRQQRDCSSTP